jgi:hypothetical protein
MVRRSSQSLFSTRWIEGRPMGCENVRKVFAGPAPEAYQSSLCVADRRILPKSSPRGIWRLRLVLPKVRTRLNLSLVSHLNGSPNVCLFHVLKVSPNVSIIRFDSCARAQSTEILKALVHFQSSRVHESYASTCTAEFHNFGSERATCPGVLISQTLNEPSF